MAVPQEGVEVRRGIAEDSGERGDDDNPASSLVRIPRDAGIN